MSEPLTRELAEALWHEALNSELGIVIGIPEGQEPDTIRRELYAAKQRLSDIRLASLTLHVPADGSRIIIRKETAHELP